MQKISHGALIMIIVLLLEVRPRFKSPGQILATKWNISSTTSSQHICGKNSES